MSNTSAKDINITINSDNSKNSEDNDYDETYQEFKKYIIRQNVFLQNQHSKDILEIKHLEHELSKKEDEEDKNDTRIRYLKGLMQNLITIKDEYNVISQKYKNISKTYEYINLHTNKICNDYLIYSTLFIISLYLFKINYVFDYKYYIFIYNIIISILIIFLINKISNIYKKYIDLVADPNGMEKIKQITKEIFDKKVELKKIEDSTITLDNWICEV
jgi:hypothetical protein